jgi:hypothetical protein
MHKTITGTTSLDKDDLRKVIYSWPYKIVLILPLVQTMPQPYAPNDIAVCTYSSHNMPDIVSAMKVFEDMYYLPPPMPF